MAVAKEKTQKATAKAKAACAQLKEAKTALKDKDGLLKEQADELSKLKTKFRKFRSYNKSSDFTSRFTALGAKDKLKGKDLDKLLMEFAKEKHPHVYEKLTIVSGDKKTKGSLEKDLTLHYGKICRGLGLTDLKDPANTIAIEVEVGMGYLKKILLSKEAVENAKKLGMPEAAHYEYIDTLKSENQSSETFESSQYSHTKDIALVLFVVPPSL